MRANLIESFRPCLLTTIKRSIRDVKRCPNCKYVRAVFWQPSLFLKEFDNEPIVEPIKKLSKNFLRPTKTKIESKNGRFRLEYVGGSVSLCHGHSLDFSYQNGIEHYVHVVV